jgi:hypothetical protein
MVYFEFMFVVFSALGKLKMLHDRSGYLTLGLWFAYL